MIDIVSDLTKDVWNNIYDYDIYTFFNLVTYQRQKDDKLKQQINKWKTQN